MARARIVLRSLVVALCVFLASFAGTVPARDAPAGTSESRAQIVLRDLPREAQATIALIRKGGPFPYDRDGVVFGNYERMLPLRERGYYREYTVPTPGVRSRGARRIVHGRAGELYYTDDHYRTFRRVKE